MPQADDLAALLASGGPVDDSMDKAKESSDKLLASAESWKTESAKIKQEFHDSVEKQVDIGGAKLERESDSVKEDTEKQPKEVLQQLKEKHTANAPNIIDETD